MKRILSLILAILMCVCVFAACDSSSGNETDPDTEAKTEAPTDAPDETDAQDDTKESEPRETEPDTTPTVDTEPEAPTQTDSDTTTDTETETETGVSFKDDFMIAGEYADQFKSELKSNKINTGKTTSSTVIYVGEASAAIVNTAKANLTQPNSYYDFTVITDGKDLAIYATSDYAIAKAIEYVIENYTQGGYIAVPDNFTYTSLADLPNITIGGNTLENMTVVAKDDLQDLASGLAKDLTLLTGYTVAYGNGAEGATIELSANSSSSTIGSSYTVSYSNSKLCITAENKITLAYAISGFMKNLKNGLVITEGFSETYTLETQTAAATNTELFKYCGTWQATDTANPTTMVSYWDAAYVEVDFTGNAITLMFSSATTFLYRIDDGEYRTVSNVIGDYTVYATDGGTHTVRVLYNEKSQSMYFAGVKAGADVTLSRTPDRKYYVQFVGDSISDATNSFSHNSADLIDWDYSVIACEALSIVKDMGYWRYNNGFKDGVLAENSMAWHFKQNFGVTSVGMEDAYFKLGIPNKWTESDPRFADVAANYYTEKYDFDFNTGNTPDIVFIFLGTNDLGLSADENTINTFVSTYKSFVEKLLDIYGDETQIVIMQGLSTSNISDPYNVNSARYTAIRRVATELEEVHPDNITFLDENTLFTWGVDISSDGTHPSTEGYATLSEKVAQWLEKKFK